MCSMNIWTRTNSQVPPNIRGPFEKFMDSPYYSESEVLEVRWRSLFRRTSLGRRCTSYNAPSTSPKRAANRWSLRNFLPRSSLFMIWKAQKSQGVRSESNSVFSLEKVDRWNPIRTSAIQSRSRLMRFLGFSNYEKGAPRQEIWKWSTVCSKFSRSGWSVVRSASLAKGGKLKVKVKLSLCFNWGPRHEGVSGEWRYSSTHSWTLALDGCDVLRKSDRHRTSTKFRLWVIRWVHELCKRRSKLRL
jgi:hypothetical protein